MSMLNGRKAYLPLDENKVYTVILTGMVERALDAPTDNFLGYVDFKWQVSEDGRIVNDSRSCPVGTDILARQVLEQLNNPALNAIEQEELFHSLIDNKTVLNMWVTKNMVETTTYTNYTFKKPIELPTIGATQATVSTETTEELPQ